MRPILIFAPSIGFRIFCGSAVLCALIFGSSEAFAQSATGVPANTATARSLTDATDQIQKDLIDREVLGLSSSGGVAVGIGVSPSGRLRTSAHDGLKDNLGGKTFSFDADEASAFANVVAGVPGTTLGGQVKFSGFVGYNSLSLDIKSNHVKILDPNQFGGARNESFVAGGTALWGIAEYLCSSHYCRGVGRDNPH